MIPLTNPEDDLFALNEGEVNAVELSVSVEETPLTEKQKADKQRDEALEKSETNSKKILISFPIWSLILFLIFYVDTPLEATHVRSKRQKLTVDEEILLRRENHEIALEEKRFRMDQEVKNREFELEKKRLELEMKKEERLAEESRRRDEFMGAMCNVLSKLIPK